MKQLLVIGIISLFSFSGCETAKQITDGTNNTGRLTDADIVKGLKEALRVGTDSSVKRLSMLNGFFEDQAIKIFMPPEVMKVEKTLRNLGSGLVVDKAILSMNRAAEEATKYAGDIFWNSIKQMTITDAIGILKGGDSAATTYLRRTTTAELTTAFRPVIEKSLADVNATKYWSNIFTAYNRVSRVHVNPDLAGYVTEKALAGLFYNIGLEEQKIRKDPVARVTDILKKVFGG
jgi:hypothetical protein